MSKTINFKETVWEICSKYPEAKDILARLGFHDITKPGVLNTAGKFMTIPWGASMRGIDLSKVTLEFLANGFEIEGAGSGKSRKHDGENAAPAAASAGASPDAPPADKDSRTALLKEYVGRLSRGDSLEAVRKDFVAHFQSVDAAEIANAEQELILSGTPVAEVQKLCDVHSALFHGATREEQIANAEKAVQASAGDADNPLSKIPGHPVGVFAAENNALSGLISEIKKCVSAGDHEDVLREKLRAFRAVTVHYA